MAEPGIARLGETDLEVSADETLAWLPQEVRARSIVRELDAGAHLFRRGDRATAIFEVERGRLQLIRYVDARAIVLHTANPGGLFAEAALFSSTYHCDAVAAVPSRVRVYPKRPLLVAFRAEPERGQRFTAVLAHEIHRLRARLEERNIRGARERVLHHLLLAAGEDSRTVKLDGTLMDLATEIGLTHEALYRALAALSREGVIERRGTELRLLKPV